MSNPLDEMIASKQVVESLSRVSVAWREKAENQAPETISEWQSEVHSLAKQKGWYDRPKSDVEALCLAIGEISEAVEEIRKGVPSYYEVDGKPEGVQVEVADCIIRLLDLAEYRGWNIEEVMKKKHEYNKGREKMHGKKL